MKKGLVITGLAFLIGIVLIASANYLILSREKREEASTYKMRIDAVGNRHFDAQWIIDSAAREAVDESNNCTHAAEIAEDYIEDALESEEMNTGPVTFNFESSNIGMGYDDDEDEEYLSVGVTYRVNSEEKEIEKRTTFSENYYGCS